MTLVRVGLAETKHFSEGYEAIFGKKKSEKKTGKPRAKSRAGKKSKSRKK